jgi:hypothetical protein
MWSVQSGYKEENRDFQLAEGWQFSSALQGGLRRDGARAELIIELGCGIFA